MSKELQKQAFPVLYGSPPGQLHTSPYAHRPAYNEGPELRRSRSRHRSRPIAVNDIPHTSVIRREFCLLQLLLCLRSVVAVAVPAISSHAEMEKAFLPRV